MDTCINSRVYTLYGSTYLVTESNS